MTDRRGRDPPLNGGFPKAAVACHRNEDRQFSQASAPHPRRAVFSTTEGKLSRFEDQSNQVYDMIFNANVRGAFWSMKHEAKVMLANGGGFPAT